MSSPRKRGPITTDACCRECCGPSYAQHSHWWLWVPDRVRCAHLSGTTEIVQLNFQTAKPSQTRVYIPAAQCARVVYEPLAPKRAWGMPGARCTRSLVCKVLVAHECSHHRSTGNTRHSRTRVVLTVSFVLPGDRALLSPSPVEIASTDLTPASRRQDHTTSPSAHRCSRQQHHPRPPHSAPRP
jgi:hypothetical protein